ncbi:MAG: aminotransferase class III-fold pyridoxal phosphate-dependent enzyme [Armatimonadetes bacterium]|nr:aminotransferase class III-fold pyridoxal phosphate-dependent enzyme [Armatimonadota bacterium]MDE2207420.1 aminotransferase class III-fold pyridoxal phosphate-dependent enzyme [Armatimonadota bacterium]
MTLKPPITGSAYIAARAAESLPGGTVSYNRRMQPELAFTRAHGPYMWDADGRRYLDFHAAFAPFLLGHANTEVDEAVVAAITDRAPLAGAGVTPMEVDAAELFLQCVRTAEQVQFTTSGSEATYHALRLARAVTGRSHIVVMQGGYNGWHDHVACNVMTPLSELGPRVSPGEYPYLPMTAGVAAGVAETVHPINFNDLDSARLMLEKYPVAAVITEPILQNVGIIKPQPGYLAGLQNMCRDAGALFILDEIKTGFRHALGGWQSIEMLSPDLSVFGKAIANGYALGAVAGSRTVMERFAAPDVADRVLIGGTYNGHPAPMAAAIATMRLLQRDEFSLYPRLDSLGARMQAGLEAAASDLGLTATVARQGSAYCLYFMDHLPVDWHDILLHHNFAADVEYRRRLIDAGVFHFPVATKQSSISTAHSEYHIDLAVKEAARAMEALPV